MDEISKRLQAMELAEQEVIVDLLAQELRPLDSSNSQGLDKTVQTLIKVIQYMSENAPEDGVNFQELSPDQLAKIARLGQAAKRRMQDHVIQAKYHTPVQAAREAVGIDAVRVKKFSVGSKSKAFKLS